MTRNKPRFCQHSAYESFREAVPTIDRTESLIQVAVAISQHLMMDASLSSVHDELDELAEAVQSRLSHGSQAGTLAHLHDVLFEEQHFQGSSDDYYNARNSCLPYVLKSHRGIPITLVLVYKLVAERLGLTVNGLNCPGHFLAEVITDNDRMIIDPFRHGIMLTQEEARQYIEQVIQQPIDSSQVTNIASHAAWITRILRNLQNIFSMQENTTDLRAMCELEELLNLAPE